MPLTSNAFDRRYPVCTEYFMLQILDCTFVWQCHLRLLEVRAAHGSIERVKAMLIETVLQMCGVVRLDVLYIAFADFLSDYNALLYFETCDMLGNSCG